MQVTFLTHIRQIPGGSVGSIVRLTSRICAARAWAWSASS
jgi:hypothetical protein